MFIVVFFDEKIVAKANVTIAVFTHLHIVSIRDDKNKMKITKNKKYLFY